MATEWYYLSERRERLPFSDADVPTLVRGGILRPETLVWQRGLPAWISGSEIRPEWFSGSAASKSKDTGAASRLPPTADAAAVRSAAAALLGARNYFRWLGAGLIVGGSLAVARTVAAYFMTDWGTALANAVSLPIGLLSMVGGGLLLRATRQIEAAGAIGQPSQLGDGLRQLHAIAALMAWGVWISVVLTLGLLAALGVLVVRGYGLEILWK